jgi:hypothetical protein
MRMAFLRMLFAHGDQAGTGRIDDEVRMARVAARSEGAGAASAVTRYRRLSAKCEKITSSPSTA